MRLIDADSTYLQDAIGRNSFKTRDDIRALIENAPTIDPDALEDEANKCVVGGYHEWVLSAIGSDGVGNKVNTYQCRKCGEEFKVKFEEV